MRPYTLAHTHLQIKVVSTKKCLHIQLKKSNSEILSFETEKNFLKEKVEQLENKINEQNKIIEKQNKIIEKLEDMIHH